jgi:polyisoprenoid-binding protein YceI
MRQRFFLAGLALVVFAALSQTGTQAVNVTFADRFAAAAPVGESGTYGFDKAHSAIGFKVKHNGLIDIPGFFRDFTGSINYDAKDVTKSTVEFTAKATSIDTGVAGRDNHLRSKDFFEVEKFADVTFKSTKVEKKGKSWMLTGDFTMKGVTKTITFPFNIAGFLPAGERSGARMGFTAETMINRRDFGVNYGGNIPGTNTPVIADNIAIRIEVEAPAPRPAAPAAAAPKSE